jgi:hypothetical protein
MFADAITATVAQQIQSVQVLTLDQGDAAKFAHHLEWSPKGVTMNAVQQQYFADVTAFPFVFKVQVLDLQVDEQIDNDGSIQVVGKLLGIFTGLLPHMLVDWRARFARDGICTSFRNCF